MRNHEDTLSTFNCHLQEKLNVKQITKLEPRLESISHHFLLAIASKVGRRDIKFCCLSPKEKKEVNRGKKLSTANNGDIIEQKVRI